MTITLWFVMDEPMNCLLMMKHEAAGKALELGFHVSEQSSEADSKPLRLVHICPPAEKENCIQC